LHPRKKRLNTKTEGIGFFAESQVEIHLCTANVVMSVFLQSSNVFSSEKTGGKLGT
jgi:hypothetical protein